MSSQTSVAITTLSPLNSSFFAQPTVSVASALLGQYLVVGLSNWDSPCICRIVETEAYTQDDPACHSYQRRTGRAATLYKTPGIAYVYFIYGMYYCLNAITEPEDRAGAVLIRAIEPLWHPDTTLPLSSLKTNGPGRLCKTLNISKADHNEWPLTTPNAKLWIAKGDNIPSNQIVTTTRIGIKKATEYPLRFYILNNPWVSVKAR